MTDATDWGVGGEKYREQEGEDGGAEEYWRRGYQTVQVSNRSSVSFDPIVLHRLTCCRQPEKSIAVVYDVILSPEISSAARTSRFQAGRSVGRLLRSTAWVHGHLIQSTVLLMIITMIYILR